MEQQTNNNVSDMFAPTPNVPSVEGNFSSYQRTQDLLGPIPFLDWNRLDPNWKLKYQWNMNQADKKYQYEYDKANLANKANVQDWLNKNSSKYNYELAKNWDQNKYKYNMEGQLKAGINPLIASIGSGGPSGSPSGLSNGVSSSNGNHNNSYSQSSTKNKSKTRDLLGMVKDILLIGALF